MRLKLLSLLLLASILFSGCTNSNTSLNKSLVTKGSTVSSQKENSLDSTTLKDNKGTTSRSNVKIIPLSPAQTGKIKDKLNPVLTEIDNALNSLDEPKDPNLN